MGLTGAEDDAGQEEEGWEEVERKAGTDPGKRSVWRPSHLIR